jgi:putative heme-binding domain-containing protein
VTDLTWFATDLTWFVTDLTKSEADKGLSEGEKGLSAGEKAGDGAAAGAADAARVRETALWWLLNRKDSTWKAHGLNAALKERGLYDPEKITLLSAPLPAAVATTFSTADAAKLTGDAKRGEAVAARCFLCHQIGGTGADYGPDLSTFGRTQTTEALLRSIVEPDADIAHGFAGTRVETHDGIIIEGLVLSESDPLLIRSAGGVTQMVPAARVKTKTALQGRSLMMSAAQLGLTAQEAADVAAYLRGR